jgi:hypothetical protein
MASITKRQPACKVNRQIILLRPVAPGRPGLVQITASGQTARYTVRNMASGIGGRAFELAKVGAGPTDDGPYHVLCDGEASICHCKGFFRFGPRQLCRHLWGMATLIRRGLV